MPARVAGRTGASRPVARVRAIDPHRAPAAKARDYAQSDNAVEEWIEPEHDKERLDEGEMEMLLTGHAATHGIEGEDNWLIETEEQSLRER